MPEIERRDEPDGGHTYWLAGQQLPGITSVLSAVGYNGKASAFYTPDSRQKGTAVHKACALADRMAPDATTVEEVLEVIDLHPDIVPYAAGWLLFCQEKQFRPCGWERALWSKTLRTAGTCDTWDIHNGVFRLVDLKSWKNQGAKPKVSAELQTAGYVIMAREMGIIQPGQKVERYVLKLSGNGKFRVYPCTGMDEEYVVYACKTWWKQYAHKLVTLSGDPDDGVAALE